MELLILVLILLSLIGVSNIINHFLPVIPIPLVQISLGILVAALSPELHIIIEPELFFVLFIAPLLFNDGKRFPREKLWTMRWPILLLALGLVFATVFVVGYVIHWMIPTLPLPAAFALAAILSPTDAVAVSSIAGRIHLPSNIMHLLEGEALMNDASGLVAFKFAVAATLTGTFSLREATVSFFVIAVGGLLIGALTAFCVIRFRISLRRMGMEDVTMNMLIQLLTPFAIYLLAEHLGLSGILAVVAGGIIHSIEQDLMQSGFSGRMHVVSESTWSVILFILNGLIFVILGLEIPDVLKVIWKDENFNNLQVISYIVLTSIALIILRFLWIFLFSEGSRLFLSKDKQTKVGMRFYLMTSLSGVRGAVTLAGAFSIPMVLYDGSSFPERNLMIFISAGVILFTLLTASFVLPLISRKKKTEITMDLASHERTLKEQLIEAIIYSLKEDMCEENREAVSSVISDYRKLFITIANSEYDHSQSKVLRKMELKVRLVGIEAEKKELQKLLAQGNISPENAARARENINQLEVLFSRQIKFRFAAIVILLLSKWNRVIQSLFRKKSRMHKDVQVVKDIKIKTSKAAIEAIKNEINEENRGVSLMVISHYAEMIERLEQGFRKSKKDTQFRKRKRDIQYKALQAGRDRIQLLFESREITRENSIMLRQFINVIEAEAFEEESILPL